MSLKGKTALVTGGGKNLGAGMQERQSILESSKTKDSQNAFES